LPSRTSNGLRRGLTRHDFRLGPVQSNGGDPGQRAQRASTPSQRCREASPHGPGRQRRTVPAARGNSPWQDAERHARPGLLVSLRPSTPTASHKSHETHSLHRQGCGHLVTPLPGRARVRRREHRRGRAASRPCERQVIGPSSLRQDATGAATRRGGVPVSCPSAKNFRRSALTRVAFCRQLESFQDEELRRAGVTTTVGGRIIAYGYPRPLTVALIGVSGPDAALTTKRSSSGSLVRRLLW
jgi:hypothetical protein